MEKYFMSYTFTYNGKVFFDNCMMKLSEISDMTDVSNAEIDILYKIQQEYNSTDITNVTIINFQRL